MFIELTLEKNGNKILLNLDDIKTIESYDNGAALFYSFDKPFTDDDFIQVVETKNEIKDALSAKNMVLSVRENGCISRTLSPISINDLPEKDQYDCFIIAGHTTTCANNMAFNNKHCECGISDE